MRKRNIKKKLLKYCLSALPKAWRFKLFRQLVEVPYELPSELSFKLAETKEELEAAFNLLHDAYVKEGFMKPEESGLRVTPYHFLPSTSTLIALWDGEVIGTVSIIRDNIFGLPMEKIFNLNRYRNKHEKIAEISSLAIHPDFKKMSGTILFPLCKFLFEYCKYYFGVDYMVIAVNPRAIEFYESLLLFKRIQEEVVENYSFVNGAPAVGAYLNLKTARDRYLNQYLHAPSKKNLASFFLFVKFEMQFNFPERLLYKINDPVITPDLLNYFGNQKTKTLQNLTDYEKSVLRTIYLEETKYLEYIPHPKEKVYRLKYRNNIRFDVKCLGFTVCKEKMENISLNIKNISFRGFQAMSNRKMHLDKEYKVIIQLSPTSEIEVICAPCWELNNLYGFQILSHHSKWNYYIEYLHRDTLKHSNNMNFKKIA